MNRYSCGRTIVFALAIMLHAGDSWGGQVYGTVVGTAGPAQAATVVSKCPGNVTAKRATDEYGSYSVYVDAIGRCDVWVNNIGPLSIRVYEDDVRYDIRLTNNGLTRD